MTHELKILPEFFEKIVNSEKSFEVRKNDRNFKVGDYVLLNECLGEKLSGDNCLCKITYILSALNGYAHIEAGYIILGIKLIDVNRKRDDKGAPRPRKERITTTLLKCEAENCRKAAEIAHRAVTTTADCTICELFKPVTIGTAQSRECDCGFRGLKMIYGACPHFKWKGENEYRKLTEDSVV